MKENAKEPIFTARGWIAIALLGCVYAAIFFSLDRDWVNWAAPLAFGGVLYPLSPPPASVPMLLPEHVFPIAWFFNLAGLFALLLLGENAGITAAASLDRLKSRFLGMPAVRMPDHPGPRTPVSRD